MKTLFAILLFTLSVVTVSAQRSGTRTSEWRIDPADLVWSVPLVDLKDDPIVLVADRWVAQILERIAKLEAEVKELKARPKLTIGTYYDAVPTVGGPWSLGLAQNEVQPDPVALIADKQMAQETLHALVTDKHLSSAQVRRLLSMKGVKGRQVALLLRPKALSTLQDYQHLWVRTSEAVNTDELLSALVVALGVSDPLDPIRPCTAKEERELRRGDPAWHELRGKFCRRSPPHNSERAKYAHAQGKPKAVVTPATPPQPTTPAPIPVSEPEATKIKALQEKANAAQTRYNDAVTKAQAELDETLKPLRSEWGELFVQAAAKAKFSPADVATHMPGPDKNGVYVWLKRPDPQVETPKEK